MQNKIRFSKTISCVLLGMLMLTTFVTTALADTQTQSTSTITGVCLSLSEGTANPGDTVTASGTGGANTWISVKIVDSAQNIVFFDAIKSGADGTYSDTFKAPSLPGSTLTVVAGYGSNVDTKSLIVNNLTTMLTPPTLAADSSGNIAGSAVKLAFLEDTAWRAAITSITVDGTALTMGQNSTTAGSINIAAGVLNTAGNHTIVVRATGYADASIILVITANQTPGEKPTLSSLKAGIPNNTVLVGKHLFQLTDTNGLNQANVLAASATAPAQHIYFKSFNGKWYDLSDSSVTSINDLTNPAKAVDETALIDSLQVEKWFQAGDSVTNY